MTPRGNDSFGRRIPVIGMAGLLAVVLGGVFLGGPMQRSDPPRSPALESRDLRFSDMLDGGVAVTDARDGSSVAVFGPGTGGFVRGAMRGLARERRRDGGPAEEAPFRLAAWPDGRFTLEDTVTGHVIDLHAFGRTQTETFIAMLQAPAGAAHNTRGGVR
jgi:putative photosynthetic complex assembly protein